MRQASGATSCAWSNDSDRSGWPRIDRLELERGPDRHEHGGDVERDEQRQPHQPADDLGAQDPAQPAAGGARARPGAR